MHIVLQILSNTSIKLVMLSILGLCIGSFLNVVIYRLPMILNRQWWNDAIDVLENKCNLTKINQSVNLVVPASFCPECKHKISWWLNIPLLGFVLSQGRCYFCKTQISWVYPSIELLTGILFIWCGWVFSSLITLSAALIFVSICICIVVIDFKTFCLPDELSLSLLWLGLLFNLTGEFSGSLTSSVLGAVLAYLILWSIYWVFKLITKKEGMGYGDFKLFAALGAWFGCSSLISILLISSLSGIVYSIILKLNHRLNPERIIPFGPFLGLAGIVMLLFEFNYLRIGT